MFSLRSFQTRPRPGWCLTLLLALLLCGCAAGQTGGPTPDKAQPPDNAMTHGFLSDYGRLKPMDGQKGATAWRREGVNWSRYDKVLIERMQVFLKQEGTPKGIDPTDLKALVDYFCAALAKEVQKSATLVNEPGPGVLRVRIAIVDLVPTVALASAVGTAVPYAFAAELASGVASGRPAGSTPYLGKTGIQAQFLDGVSGQVVAEFSDSDVGRKYVADLSQGVPNAAEHWANGYFHSFTTWGYARDAFDKWAKLLRERFDQLRGIKAGLN